MTWVTREDGSLANTQSHVVVDAPVSGSSLIKIDDGRPVIGRRPWYTIDDLVYLLTTYGGITGVPVLYTRLEMRRATTINNGATGAGWFNVQPLNTVAVDEIGVVLAANAFTLPALPAGYSVFRCRAHAPAYRSGLHQLSVFNVTDGVTRIPGTSEALDSTTVTQTRSFVTTELAASTQYRLEHYVQFANAVGLGQASNSGSEEVYAVVEIWAGP